MPENPLGVIYIVKLHIGKDGNDFVGSKATSVKMMIDKVILKWSTRVSKINCSNCSCKELTFRSNLSLWWKMLPRHALVTVWST